MRSARRSWAWCPSSVHGQAVGRRASHRAPTAHATAEHDEGHVSSVAYSPTLGHDIALAFLRRGADRIGETIRVVDLLRDADVACRVVDPVFIDPKGREAAWLAPHSSRAPALAGTARLGRYGARSESPPGVILCERTDLAIAHIASRKGQAVRR